MITRDSSLAFFVNQLDAFDTKIHEPLAAVTWSRDVKLRAGISLGNQSTSFVRGNFAHAGQQSAQGAHFIGSAKNTSLTAVGVDGTQVVLPMQLWGGEIRYNAVELERSQLIGQNLDDMQTRALQLSYNLDVDRMVYVGGAGQGGLINSTDVTVASALGATWSAGTADTILQNVNDLIKAAWAASAYAVCPNVLLLPPAQYALIVAKKAGTDGAGGSVLNFLQNNSISLQVNGVPLDIRPCKHLTGAGDSGKDRMVAYNDSELYVRYPLAPIVRQTPYYQGITFAAPYVAALGAVEFVYPETAIYQDGL